MKQSRICYGFLAKIQRKALKITKLSYCKEVVFNFLLLYLILHKLKLHRLKIWQARETLN